MVGIKIRKGCQYEKPGRVDQRLPIYSKRHKSCFIVIASDQISRSPEPFGFAQDKLREGVAILPLLGLLQSLRSFAMTPYLVRLY
jgi:hypothetical protein